MFTMTFEFADTETQATPQEERRYLMEKRVPPDNWMVWIAEVEKGGAWDVGITYHKALGLETDERSVEKPNCQTTTFAFGQLLIHTFGTTADFHFKAAEYGHRLGLQAVWPITDSAIVKPQRAHTDEEALFVATALYTSLAEFVG